MNANCKNQSVAGFLISSKTQSKTVKFRLDEDLHDKEKVAKPQRGREHRVSASEYADFQ